MVTLVLQTRISDTKLAHGPEWPSATALMEVASARAGLTDFGPDDFIAGLEHLLASLVAEGELGDEARAGVVNVLVRRLESRLRTIDWHRRHPDATAVPVPGPLCITGLPRTGTTALANMMSLDPQFRCLPQWEQAEPWLDEHVGDKLADPRRQAMVERLTGFIADNPEQMAMHLYEVDATDEDHDVLGLAFMAQHNTLPVGGYRSWWRAADMRPAYAFHRQVLQMLQVQHGGRPWLLKAPHYKFHMRAIADIYPEVRFVFTHRDPVKTLPSYVSYATGFYPPGTVERIGIKTVAREIYTHLLEGMRTAMADRAMLGDDRFVDVAQDDLNRDPEATLERLYDALGLPLSDAFIDALRAWNEAHASGAHGAHRYSAEQFGLSVDEIRADFAFYTDRFGP